MIKLIVFDLDGVLVEARDFHYEAMNRALASIDEKYIIGREEHLAKYDGLSTRKKLAILTKEKGLPEEHYDIIWEAKQRSTHEIIREQVTPENHENVIACLYSLKSMGYTVYCASNSIRSTVCSYMLATWNT